MADNKILLRTNFSATLLPRLFLLIEFNVVLAQVRACVPWLCVCTAFALTLSHPLSLVAAGKRR